MMADTNNKQTKFHFEQRDRKYQNGQLPIKWGPKMKKKRKNNNNIQHTRILAIFCFFFLPYLSTYSEIGIKIHVYIIKRETSYA